MGQIFFQNEYGEQEIVRTDNPLPVVPRDATLVIYNPMTIEITATSANPNNIDPLGDKTGAPTIVIPNAWQIRRITIVGLRNSTATATLEARLYGRLVDANGNPIDNTWWVRGGDLSNANDGTAYSGTHWTRIIFPATIGAPFGFDQYRITFHLSSSSGGKHTLSHIRIYVE